MEYDGYMMEYDGPPYEERFTSDDTQREETYLDGLLAAARAINSIYQERGLQSMLELEKPVEDYTEETLHQEIEKLYRSAGEIAIGKEIKARIEILIKEARLRNS